MEKSLINLTIFLIKEDIEEIEDCLKHPTFLNSSDIKPEYGLTGCIYYSDSNRKAPRWKQYLDKLSSNTIDISDNSSNKAITLVKIKGRIMAIVFGYGRSFLREECIERNFGLKVALNIIDPDKMRSVNAATIEDMVVTTQRQASYSTSQDEFGLNVTNDIMKGVTGEPYNEKYGKHVSGKDSLVVSVFMELSELKEKLEVYYSAYGESRYKAIGFEWVDNVSEVRDGVLFDVLDEKLIEAIESRQIEHLHIAPPETTNWDLVTGFCYSGIGLRMEDPNNFKPNLNIAEYIEKIKPGTQLLAKLHRDKLHGLTADGASFVICNIYSALVFQIEYYEKHYILCAGAWYQVETSFFEQVDTYIRTRIEVADIELPDCEETEKEADYNKKASKDNPAICLMDRKLMSVANGPKQIEACDLFTSEKQFIHVKNRGQSAQLSHLFAQGKVSAECFVSDVEFRKQVSDIISEKFGESVFDAEKKPSSNEFEIIYAIIAEENSLSVDKLPFFSKVNLMLATQELDRMHFKCSIYFIKRT